MGEEQGEGDPITEGGEEAEFEESQPVQPGQGAQASKRRRASTPGNQFLEQYLERKEERERAREMEKDHVQQFLVSLAPAMRNLSEESQSLVKLKFQQILHEAQFGQRVSGTAPVYTALTPTHTLPHYSGDHSFVAQSTYMNL